jgi:hypothetical protein
MDEIRKRIISGTSLSISRVPKNTINRFKEIGSNDDFCKDYGMTLKYLIDFHDGIVIHGNEQILNAIEQLNQDITMLKKEVFKPKEESKKRSMLNGE